MIKLKNILFKNVHSDIIMLMLVILVVFLAVCSLIDLSPNESSEKKEVFKFKIDNSIWDE